MDCSLPGSSVHGISQARVLEWGAIDYQALGHRGNRIEKILASVEFMEKQTIKASTIKRDDYTKKKTDDEIYRVILEKKVAEYVSTVTFKSFLKAPIDFFLSNNPFFYGNSL